MNTICVIILMIQMLRVIYTISSNRIDDALKDVHGESNNDSLQDIPAAPPAATPKSKRIVNQELKTDSHTPIHDSSILSSLKPTKSTLPTIRKRAKEYKDMIFSNTTTIYSLHSSSTPQYQLTPESHKLDISNRQYPTENTKSHTKNNTEISENSTLSRDTDYTDFKNPAITFSSNADIGKLNKKINTTLVAPIFNSIVKNNTAINHKNSPFSKQYTTISSTRTKDLKLKIFSGLKNPVTKLERLITTESSMTTLLNKRKITNNVPIKPKSWIVPEIVEQISNNITTKFILKTSPLNFDSATTMTSPTIVDSNIFEVNITGSPEKISAMYEDINTKKAVKTNNINSINIIEKSNTKMDETHLKNISTTKKVMKTINSDSDNINTTLLPKSNQSNSKNISGEVEHRFTTSVNYVASESKPSSIIKKDTFEDLKSETSRVATSSKTDEMATATAIPIVNSFNDNLTSTMVNTVSSTIMENTIPTVISTTYPIVKTTTKLIQTKNADVDNPTTAIYNIATAVTLKGADLEPTNTILSYTKGSVLSTTMSTSETGKNIDERVNNMTASLNKATSVTSKKLNSAQSGDKTIHHIDTTASITSNAKLLTTETISTKFKEFNATIVTKTEAIMNISTKADLKNGEEIFKNISTISPTRTSSLKFSTNSSKDSDMIIDNVSTEDSIRTTDAKFKKLSTEASVKTNGLRYSNITIPGLVENTNSKLKSTPTAALVQPTYPTLNNITTMDLTKIINVRFQNSSTTSSPKDNNIRAASSTQAIVVNITTVTSFKAIDVDFKNITTTKPTVTSNWRFRKISTLPLALTSSTFKNNSATPSDITSDKRFYNYSTTPSIVTNDRRFKIITSIPSTIKKSTRFNNFRTTTSTIVSNTVPTKTSDKSFNNISTTFSIRISDTNFRNVSIGSSTKSSTINTDRKLNNINTTTSTMTGDTNFHKTRVVFSSLSSEKRLENTSTTALTITSDTKFHNISMLSSTKSPTLTSDVKLNNVSTSHSTITNDKTFHSVSVVPSTVISDKRLKNISTASSTITIESRFNNISTTAPTKTSDTKFQNATVVSSTISKNNKLKNISTSASTLTSDTKSRNVSVVTSTITSDKKLKDIRTTASTITSDISFHNATDVFSTITIDKRLKNISTTALTITSDTKLVNISTSSPSTITSDKKLKNISTVSSTGTSIRRLKNITNSPSTITSDTKFKNISTTSSTITTDKRLKNNSTASLTITSDTKIKNISTTFSTITIDTKFKNINTTASIITTDKRLKNISFPALTITSDTKFMNISTTPLSVVTGNRRLQNISTLPSAITIDTKLKNINTTVSTITSNKGLKNISIPALTITSDTKFKNISTTFSTISSNGKLKNISTSPSTINSDTKFKSINGTASTITTDKRLKNISTAVLKITDYTNFKNISTTASTIAIDTKPSNTNTTASAITKGKTLDNKSTAPSTITKDRRFTNISTSSLTKTIDERFKNTSTQATIATIYSKLKNISTLASTKTVMVKSKNVSTETFTEPSYTKFKNINTTTPTITSDEKLRNISTESVSTTYKTSDSSHKNITFTTKGRTGSKNFENSSTASPFLTTIFKKANHTTYTTETTVSSLSSTSGKILKTTSDLILNNKSTAATTPHNTNKSYQTSDVPTTSTTYRNTTNRTPSKPSTTTPTENKSEIPKSTRKITEAITKTKRVTKAKITTLKYSYLVSSLIRSYDHAVFLYLTVPFPPDTTHKFAVLVQEYKKGYAVDDILTWYQVNNLHMYRYAKYKAIEVSPEKILEFFHRNPVGSGKVRERRDVKLYPFYIGNDDKCQHVPDKLVCNGPLRSGRSYRFQLEVFLKIDQAKRIHIHYTQFTSLHKTKQAIVQRKTPTAYGPSSELLVALSILLLLFLAVIIIILVILLKRRRSRSFCSRQSTDGIRAALMGPCNKTNSRGKYTSPDILLDRKPSIKGMTRPVSVRDFKAWVQRSVSDSEFRFAEEFESMREVGKFERHEIAEIPENRGKNRYVNILAFDYTRVKLSSIDDEPGSDYINANYIHGYKQPRAYIATQGPLPSTTDDFWRMTWEQNSRIIVMVTQCMEKGRVKCHEYWPKDEPTRYGDITVTKISDQVSPEFIERHFLLEYEGEERVIKHFQYVAWPDHGVPKSPHAMLTFIRAIKSEQTRGDGPLICHCSAGVGRTGTYLCIDILLNKLQAENNVDVYGVVCLMRTQRCCMVQTEEQYIFIHRVILLYLEQREEEISAGHSTFSSNPHRIKSVAGVNSDDSVFEALLQDVDEAAEVETTKSEIIESDNLLSEFNEEFSKRNIREILELKT